MKIVSLLPIGVALLMTIPVAAQTVEKKPVPPMPPTPPQAPAAPTPPNAPVPPTAPNAPTPPHAPVPPTPPAPPHEVTEDFVIEAPIPPEGFDADDIVVESPNPLRRLKIDSLDNMLRIRITKSVEERNELRREVQKLSNELRRKTREFRKLRIDIDKDTNGLAKALEEAGRSLEVAQLSVERLDSNIVFLRSQGRSPMVAFGCDSLSIMRNKSYVRMMTDSAMNGMRWLGFGPDAAAIQSFTRQFTDSIGGYGKHIVITRSFKDGDSVAGIRPDDPFRSFGGDEANVMMMISGDSLDQHVMVFDSRRSRTSRSDTTDGKPQHRDGGHAHPLLIRSIEQSADTPLDRASVTVLDDYIVIGKDSIQIVDGKDRQTMIHINREHATANGRSRVVVIATSYCRKTDDAAATQELAAKENVVTPTNGYKLEANTPNPFAESTTIAFTLPKPDHVTLSVFDANGSTVKVLKDEEMPAGTHTAVFDASGLPSGIYLYRLITGGFSETKTMTIAK